MSNPPPGPRPNEALRAAAERRAAEVEGERGTSSRDDHPFQPPEDRPWDLCEICHLGEAAHTDTTVHRDRRPEP